VSCARVLYLDFQLTESSYVDRVRAPKPGQNIHIPRRRPAPTHRPRLQVIAENVPEHVLRAIPRIKFAEIKAQYRIQRQREIDQGGFEHAAVANEINNPYLVRAAEKTRRHEDLHGNLKRRV
jgi:hypothetical protein